MTNATMPKVIWPDFATMLKEAAGHQEDISPPGFGVDGLDDAMLAMGEQMFQLTVDPPKNTHDRGIDQDAIVAKFLATATQPEVRNRLVRLGAWLLLSQVFAVHIRYINRAR